MTPRFPPPQGTVFSHAGDYGDLIYNIAALKIIGGGELVLHPWTKTRAVMTEKHAAGIIPLLACQPYITKLSWSQTRPLDTVALDGWRFSQFAGLGCNLQYRALHYLRLAIPDPEEPWLTVPEPKKVAKVVFHRSDRRHNHLFTWGDYVNTHKESAVDVGLPEDFRFNELPRHPCADLLELAQVIAGADLFIGNQSCPLAIAEGLKKPLICEMHDHHSVPFARGAAQYGPPMPSSPPRYGAPMPRRSQSSRTTRTTRPGGIRRRFR